MSSYPINGGDNESLLDAVNYAVSGPSGLGQQLKGFSSYGVARLTGNFRVPYSNSNFPAVLYVEPIALSTAEWLDDYTLKFTFATPQASAPFALGNGVTISGVTPSDYNDTYSRIGVVYCDENYVILRSGTAIPNPGAGSGGEAGLFVTSDYGATMSTDANAIVSVDAGNNLVSITGQIQIPGISYGVLYSDYPTVVPNVKIYVELNRYKAFNSGTAANPQYFYNYDTTISSQEIYSTNITTPTEGVPLTYNIISGTSGPTSVGFYPDIGPTSTTGNGENARIWVDITADSTDYSTSLSFVSAEYGGGYQVGDQLTFAGIFLGGDTPDNDLVLEVATVGGTGDVDIGPFETIFTPIIDTPPSGLYWYIIEINVAVESAQVPVKYIALGRRSLTAQVIKK